MSEETSIDKILKTGVKKVTVDGVATEFHDPDTLNRQNRRNDPNAKKRRPVVSSINLSGT
ncbi:hypothetical protein [Thalassoglobus polymorphus]|uniref:Uncharacterized protein n=1 Tax=Thalassoglobus polymorphus TaxID=2527994 RepID=A0A517QH58_9PLAN|nr:hypothetical protein [Thalassoglobus polymorphus]QDT30928.1 hypothetical protein Mal48_01570 [Thalassoglobus polymorphus]QDT30973.1 hypothetical protein Mal48_02020 [Thalassoglobus polymorphus]